MKTYMQKGTGCQGSANPVMLQGPKDACVLIQRSPGPHYQKLACNSTHFIESMYTDAQCTVESFAPKYRHLGVCDTQHPSYDRMYDCTMTAPAILSHKFLGAGSSSCIAGTHAKEVYWPHEMCRPMGAGSGSSLWTCDYSGGSEVPEVQLRRYPGSNTDCNGSNFTVSTDFMADGACNGASGGYYKYQSGCSPPASTTTMTSSATLPSTTLSSTETSASSFAIGHVAAVTVPLLLTRQFAL